MQFNAAVTSVTREKILPTVYDIVTAGSPLLLLLMQNAKPWTSGVRKDIIFKYQKSNQGGVVGVADKLSTERTNTRVKGQFEPKMITKPVVIADIEATLNQGDEQVLELFKTEFDSIAQDLIVDLAAELYAGTGVGDRWNSLDEAADDGTNYTTYGTLSKTTYAGLGGYYLASAGALTLAKLATAFDDISIGVDSPSHVVTTKSIWSTYESLLTPTVRAGYQQMGFPKMTAFGMVSSSEALKGMQGFDALWYRGAAVVRDEQVPSGRVFFVNKNHFAFHGITIKGKGYSTLNFKGSNEGVPAGVVGRVPATHGFNFREMMSPVDQLVEVGHVIYAGNFISTNPRLLGVMRGAS